MSQYETLVTKLREIFQIDRPDLDFGVYRILNARAGEIEEYLSSRLKARVTEALAAGSRASVKGIKEEIEKARDGAIKAGYNPDQAPTVLELQKQLAAASAGASEHENQVFSHLLTFFSRYYDKGDFISQRRYKGDTYAIPYSGEEVVLHWANRDQYYTKSGESFSNFSFKLNDGRAVHFRLVAADTAKDNRKDNDKERRFVLATARTVTRTDDDGETYEETIQPVAEEDGALVIRFDYAPQPKGTKQEALVDHAVAAILDDAAVTVRWLALTTRAPTEKNPKRTLLEKHLTTYTQKNTADYFIHKDLGGFLRRELDFYIKNEVMNLDDVQGASAFAAIEKNLRMIQCLRAIALDLITFLASIENFQKKLWLKKKFVVAAQYCVTLDRVPEALYPAIAANPAQWAQWHDLGMRASAAAGTVEDLKSAPFLMVDTALFDAGFRADLLKAIPDLDASLDGLLVHGDNFQALALLGERYRGKVKCVYIDPPYNTGGDGFIYKDSYKSSSWLSMFGDRLLKLSALMDGDGSFLGISLDKHQLYEAKLAISQTAVKFQFINSIVNVNNPKGRSDQKHLPTAHDNLMLYAVGDPVSHGWSPADKVLRRYRKAENGKKYREIDLRKTGDEDLATDRPDSAYLFAFDQKTGELFPFNRSESVDQDKYIVIKAMKTEEIEGRWRWGFATAQTNISRLVAGFQPLKQQWTVFEKDYLGDDERVNPTSVWDEKPFNSERGTESFVELGFDKAEFARPKPVGLISYFMDHTNRYGDLFLDCFAGSGTSGHAVLAQSRNDGNPRKYMLVDNGPQFDTVLKPRIQKVVYSADWSEGKPTAPETGISHAFKVLKIEGYEDTLNNLDLKRSDAQASLLEGFSADTRDDYLMRYMLDVEAKGSLLSVSDFRKPFDYTLKVAVDSAGAWEERKVDLVETFNYLIGLAVKEYDSDIPHGYVRVTGTLPDGKAALVIWRDCDVIGYERLQKLIPRFDLNIAEKSSPYDVIYINGDHNIPVSFTTTEEDGEVTRTLKLRQIEPAFLDAMFNVDDV
jgi:adenine-specific DNA-methyltransferase